MNLRVSVYTLSAGLKRRRKDVDTDCYVDSVSDCLAPADCRQFIFVFVFSSVCRRTELWSKIMGVKSLLLAPGTGPAMSNIQTRLAVFRDGEV